HYKLSDNDHFYYQRSENAFVRNFDANFDITVSSITDSDSINAKTLTNIQNISGVNIRFGRLIIDNSFGPETENLPQIFKTEYYDGNKFVLNTDDQCTTYDVSKMTLSNISLAPTTKVGATGSFVGGEHNSFQITAPGVGNTGEMGVTYDSFIWLDYDWANSDSLGNGPFTENPTAIATFGLFRGNDRIISWREVGN
ncbi:MAG: LamG domain-containing protein, partial [Colwelliaceae bacterium]|nr:LamG domain-containing protein [Colwelliaceae bacterium]